MSEDYNIQISGNIGEGLFVVRAKTADELLEKSKDLAAKIAEIYDVFGTVKQVALAKEVFSAKKNNYGSGNRSGGSAPASGSTAQTEAKPVPGGGFNCAHGAMTDLRGKVGRDGQPYRADFYCNAPRGAEKCKPVKA